MLTKPMEESLNDQLRFEAYSAYIYKAMAAYCESLELKGFANFFHVQTLEEMAHADKFFHHICDTGGRVRLGGIDEPRNDYDSVLQAFEVALAHEKIVTSRINKLSDLALKESDHASRIFLDWFVKEQVEEEGNFTTIISKLRFIGSEGQGLLMMDQELGQRVFVPPTPAA